MIAMLIFWGSIFASLGFSVAGLLQRSPRLLFFATAFALPWALYLSATPRLGWFGLLILVPQLLAGLVVRRLPWLAIALAFSFPCIVVWLTSLVGSSHSVPAV
jgi:hypothetical protein